MASPVSQLPPVQPALPSSLLTETEKERLSSQMNAVNLQISEFRQYLISKDMAANTVQVYSYALCQFLLARRYHQADFSTPSTCTRFLLEALEPPHTVNLPAFAQRHAPRLIYTPTIVTSPHALEFTLDQKQKKWRIQQKNYLGKTSSARQIMNI